MADSSSTTPIDGTNPNDLNDSNADINNELDLMNKAFQQATEVNTAITINKTKDGSEETAAQQRPNVG